MCYVIFNPCIPQVITPDMKEFLLRLKEKAVIGIVGGSDLPKMEEQMGGDGGEEREVCVRREVREKGGLCGEKGEGKKRCVGGGR